MQYYNSFPPPNALNWTYIKCDCDDLYEEGNFKGQDMYNSNEAEFLTIGMIWGAILSEKGKAKQGTNKGDEC